MQLPSATPASARSTSSALRLRKGASGCERTLYTKRKQFEAHLDSTHIDEPTIARELLESGRAAAVFEHFDDLRRADVEAAVSRLAAHLSDPQLAVTLNEVLKLTCEQMRYLRILISSTKDVGGVWRPVSGRRPRTASTAGGSRGPSSCRRLRAGSR
jgi:hypothetical protein